MYIMYLSINREGGLHCKMFIYCKCWQFVIYYSCIGSPQLCRYCSISFTTCKVCCLESSFFTRHIQSFCHSIYLNQILLILTISIPQHFGNLCMLKFKLHILIMFAFILSESFNWYYWNSCFVWRGYEGEFVLQVCRIKQGCLVSVMHSNKRK